MQVGSLNIKLNWDNIYNGNTAIFWGIQQGNASLSIQQGSIYQVPSSLFFLGGGWGGGGGG